MKKIKDIKRYAKTLVDATGLDGAQKALADISALTALMSGSRALYSTLTGPQFTGAEKEAVIAEVGKRLKFSDTTVKFVTHLCGLGALVAIGRIRDAAVALYLERKKLARATVVTPAAIGKEHEERIRASLKKLTARDVEIDYVTDPSLLGGLLVQVGSTMYDGSIKGQLRLLKDELAKGVI